MNSITKLGYEAIKDLTSTSEADGLPAGERDLDSDDAPTLQSMDGYYELAPGENDEGTATNDENIVNISTNF